MNELNQEELRKFVDREVLLSANFLISELQSNEQYQEDILEFSCGYDYEEAAKDYINSMDRDDMIEWLEFYTDEVEDLTDVDLRNKILFSLDENTLNNTDYQDFCNDHDIEPHLVEALGYWIVSDWLAEELEKRDELVTNDFLGFSVWGRTCLGQSMILDDVIQEIYNDLYNNLHITTEKDQDLPEMLKEQAC